jgi:uncharacterized phage protein (TIGR01671 family)
MREILFRGIPKNDCERHFFTDIWKDYCEGSFVYGSLLISKDRYYISVSALCKINSCINNGMTSMIEVIPETVGQYTGLTDKNGTKIFEGDIVLYEKEDEVGQIEYHESEAMFVVVFDTWQTDFDHIYSCDIEVIGNIHDNPELLKGGER